MTISLQVAPQCGQESILKMKPLLQTSMADKCFKQTEFKLDHGIPTEAHLQKLCRDGCKDFYSKMVQLQIPECRMVKGTLLQEHFIKRVLPICNNQTDPLPKGLDICTNNEPVTDFFNTKDAKACSTATSFNFDRPPTASVLQKLCSNTACKTTVEALKKTQWQECITKTGGKISDIISKVTSTCKSTPVTQAPGSSTSSGSSASEGSSSKPSTESKSKDGSQTSASKGQTSTESPTIAGSKSKNSSTDKSAAGSSTPEGSKSKNSSTNQSSAGSSTSEGSKSKNSSTNQSSAGSSTSEGSKSKNSSTKSAAGSSTSEGKSKGPKSKGPVPSEQTDSPTVAPTNSPTTAPTSAPTDSPKVRYTSSPIQIGKDKAKPTASPKTKRKRKECSKRKKY